MVVADANRMFDRTKVLRFTLCVILVLIAEMGQSAPSTDRQIVDLIAAGELEAARDLFQQSNPDAADLLFFDGRVHKAAGRYDAAIALFRDALRRDPGHLNARRELAHTLLLNREYGPAAFHFDALLEVDRDPVLRDSYWRFLDIIDREKPFGLAAQIALAPSNNVNRATTNTVFDPKNPDTGPLQITSRPESGVGLLVGLSGFYRQPVGPRLRWSAEGAVQARDYPTRLHDTATASLRLNLDHRGPDRIWQVGTFLRHTWRNDENSSQSIGVDTHVETRIGAGSRAFVGLSAETRTHPDAPWLDGPIYGAFAGISQTLDKTTNLVLGIRLAEASADRAHHGYASQAVFARLQRNWTGGLTTAIGVEVGQRGYKDLFPLTRWQRDDSYVSLNGSLQNTRLIIRGFTPELNCAYTVNSSNVDFYDYDVAECQVGFSKKF